jgi:rare lipoprotein A
MASLHLRRALTICTVLGLLFSPVQTQPLHAEASGSAEAVEEPVVPKATEAKAVEGIASYYAKRYNGRRTNSGARYRHDKMTAAHPTLPHGTRVRVINLANDKEVVVTVNDRCRPRKQPFIDLSRAAAKELGFLGKGVTRVRIIPLEDETG